jgi:hypothetical protein
MLQGILKWLRGLGSCACVVGVFGALRGMFTHEMEYLIPGVFFVALGFGWYWFFNRYIVIKAVKPLSQEAPLPAPPTYVLPLPK